MIKQATTTLTTSPVSLASQNGPPSISISLSQYITALPVFKVTQAIHNSLYPWKKPHHHPCCHFSSTGTPRPPSQYLKSIITTYEGQFHKTKNYPSVLSTLCPSTFISCSPWLQKPDTYSQLPGQAFVPHPHNKLIVSYCPNILLLPAHHQFKPPLTTSLVHCNYFFPEPHLSYKSKTLQAHFVDTSLLPYAWYCITYCPYCWLPPTLLSKGWPNHQPILLAPTKPTKFSPLY